MSGYIVDYIYHLKIQVLKTDRVNYYFTYLLTNKLNIPEVQQYYQTMIFFATKQRAFVALVWKKVVF